jgi:hypothetical protein
VAWRALAVLQKEIEAEDAKKYAHEHQMLDILFSETPIVTQKDVTPRSPLRPVCDEYAHWFDGDSLTCYCAIMTRPSPIAIGIDSINPTWERERVPPPAQDAYIDEEADVNRR